jgi:hypothetical protein
MLGGSKVLFLLLLVVSAVAQAAVQRAQPLAYGRWPLKALHENSNTRVFVNGDTLVRVVQLPERQIVDVFGVVFPADWPLVQAALSTLEQNKSIAVLTEFGGGTTGPIQGMMRILREKCPRGRCEIQTVVLSNAKCASNCITMFMMGDVRVAAETSQFGFHAATNGGQLAPGTVEKVYNGMGVSGVWLLRNRALFKSTALTYLKPQHLGDSNIVTKMLGH